MGIEKILSVFLIALTVLGVTGVLLFRYIVADQIMDKGGTTNTDYMDGTETPLYWMAIIHTSIMKSCFR